MANVDFAFIPVKSRYLDRFLQASLCGWLSQVDRVKVSVKFLCLLTLKSGKLEGSYQLAEIFRIPVELGEWSRQQLAV